MSAPISQAIHFSLGVLGGSKAKAQLLGVGVAVAGLAMKINEARKEAQEFAMQWRHLDDAGREFTQTMGSVTKDLADTTTAMKSYHALTAAGIKPTKELGSAIGRLATKEGQKMGETYDQIQQRIEALTKSIAKGTGKAFKDYGIQIINTTDLLESQEEATEKVIARAKNLKIEIENVDQAIGQLNNNWDTSIGLAYDWLTAVETGGGPISWFSEKISNMNTLMIDTNGALMDLVFSTEGFLLMLGRTSLQIANFLTPFADMTRQIDGLNRAMQALTLQKSKTAKERRQKGKKTPLFTRLPSEKKTIPTGTGKKRGGGGGRGRGPAPMPSAELEGLLDADMYEAGIAAAEEQYQTELDELLVAQSEATAAYIDELGRVWESESEAVDYRLSTEGQLEEEMRRQQLIEDQYKNHMWRILGIDNEFMDMTLAVWESGVVGKLEIMSGFFNTYTQLMHAAQGESEVAFRVGQAGAYAENMVNTFLAVTKTWAAYSNIPFAGPILAAAQSAAIIATGMLNARKIRSQKFNSGGGSASISTSGGSAPSTSAGAAGTGIGASAWQGSSTGGGQTIEINLGGDMGNLVDKIDTEVNGRFASGQWDGNRWVGVAS